MQELQVYRLTPQTLRKKQPRRRRQRVHSRSLRQGSTAHSSVHSVQRKIFDNRAASATRWTGRLPRSPRLRNALQNHSHRKAEIAVKGRHLARNLRQVHDLTLTRVRESTLVAHFADVDMHAPPAFILFIMFMASQEKKSGVSLPGSRHIGAMMTIAGCGWKLLFARLRVSLPSHDNRTCEQKWRFMAVRVNSIA